MAIQLPDEGLMKMQESFVEVLTTVKCLRESAVNCEVCGCGLPASYVFKSESAGRVLSMAAYCQQHAMEPANQSKMDLPPAARETRRVLSAFGSAGAGAAGSFGINIFLR